LGAAYSGISGATKVAQLTPRRENEGLSPAGTGTALASYEQPMPGAAYPGISAWLERNGTPASGKIANAAAPQPSSAEMGAAAPSAQGSEIKREAPVAGAATSQTAMNSSASQSTPAAVSGKQAAHPERPANANKEKVASAAGEPTKVEPAPKTAAGTQAATNEPAKTPSTETNPKVTSSIAPSTNAEATKTASAESQKAAATATTHATSAKAAPTIEAAQLRKLVGDPVVNRDGEQLGELEKVVVGPQGQIQHLVIRHGGFFGLFANHSEIDWRNAKPQIEGNKLVLALTPEQVASAPAYSGG
jgi:sporulation protein YlmC with PRC-barrel domain